MKKWLWCFAIFSLLLVGCKNNAVIDDNIIDSDIWPNSQVVVYLPVFSRGVYSSNDCDNTACEIVFKDVDLAAFNDYVATLIAWDYVVDSERKTEGTVEVYEAYTNKRGYVKVTYDTDNRILTINNNIKDMKD